MDISTIFLIIIALLVAGGIGFLFGIIGANIKKSFYEKKIARESKDIVEGKKKNLSTDADGKIVNFNKFVNFDKNNNAEVITFGDGNKEEEFVSPMMKQSWLQKLFFKQKVVNPLRNLQNEGSIPEDAEEFPLTKEKSKKEIKKNVGKKKKAS